MTPKRRRILAASAAILFALIVVGTLLFRQRVRRRTIYHPSAAEAPATPPEGLPPIETWTRTFEHASPEELDAMLDAIEAKHPDLYATWSFAYLHARALVELNERDKAQAKLGPYLVKGHPFRDLALYHRAEIAEDDEASRFRRMLIAEHPQSSYRELAIDEELEFLAEKGDPKALVAFATSIEFSASTARRREMSARIVEALVANEQLEDAFARGAPLLRGGTADDAADRTVRALDRPEILARLDPSQLSLFGETFYAHRQFERAAAVLEIALHHAYSDDLQFDLGRSYFGAEKFAEARAAYLRGASATKSANQKTTFLWHAARAAQLGGDDATAEKLMTAAIAVKGKFPSTTPALTQRLRTRLHQHRFTEAAGDLALLRKIAGGERSVLEGSLAYAVGMIVAKQNARAIAALNAIPPKLIDPNDRVEIAYWRGRALEGSDPAAAIHSYLDVLRGPSSPFQTLARQRLRETPALRHAQEAREAQVAKLVAAKQFDLAERVQTDRVLLSLQDSKEQLQKLAAIYREIPDYRAVLDLTPRDFPRFPNIDPKDPAALLMAMSLYDETVPAIESRWPLQPAREALTRSLGLNLAGAAKPSLFAIEVMMKRVPDDYQYELLPAIARELLYPRYFSGFIAEDAEKYAVDPALVFAIMREESRFDPRAKSQVAARGLLQFIITTARDVGRDIGLVDVDPDDLYDPRLIIHLGAKYMHDLGEQFGGNRYKVAAAYNAGPRQVALWSRLQPAPGDDFFVTAITFDETKGYVRKVMGSYERYR